MTNLWKVSQLPEGWDIKSYINNELRECGTTPSSVELGEVINWVEYYAKKGDLVSVNGATYVYGRTYARS